MSLELMRDYFTDVAEVLTPSAAGTNSLGEPVYGATPAVTLKGLLLARSSRVWRAMGLTEDVEAVFLTDQVLDAGAGRCVVTTGGRMYRRVTVSRTKGLEGPAMTRILLHSEAA